MVVSFSLDFNFLFFIILILGLITSVFYLKRKNFLNKSIFFQWKYFFILFIFVFFIFPSLLFLEFIIKKESFFLEKERRFIVNPNDSIFGIANNLEKEKLIKKKWPLIVQYLLTCKLQEKTPKRKRCVLQAGEYLIKPEDTLTTFLERLIRGKAFIRKLAIPEGLTTFEIVDILKKNQFLTGDIKEIPPEGSLLPATYFYQCGEKREKIIQQMRSKMEKALLFLFKEQSVIKEFFLSPQELLILASIVEKETSINEERNLIASVFFNRIKNNMPLQSDPTVVYALTKGEKKLGRPLTYKDLKFLSPYNTYRIIGLPPLPICCPGIESLKAVIKPHPSSFLYFVANGKGGHSFSKTFNEHKQHVKLWRQLKVLK